MIKLTLTMLLGLHKSLQDIFPLKTSLHHNIVFIIIHEYSISVDCSFSFSFVVKHLKLEKNTSPSASQFESITEKGESDHFTV